MFLYGFITRVCISKHYNLDLYIFNITCFHNWKEKYKKISYNSSDKWNKNVHSVEW